MKSLAPLYIDLLLWGFIPDPKKTIIDHLVGALQYYMETRHQEANTVFISTRTAQSDKLVLYADPKKLFAGIAIGEIETVDEHCFLIGRV